MRNVLRKILPVLIAVSGFVILSSWTGGPAPECAKDSVAIVRVIQPMNKLFDIKPVMFVSKGECGIDQVKVSDSENIDSKLLLKQTLTDFLSNGYTIQSATEVVDGGVQLNTYYLKKKVI
jgi:hypothetical protein